MRLNSIGLATNLDYLFQHLLLWRFVHDEKGILLPRLDYRYDVNLT
jgi:hypothetical protein